MTNQGAVANTAPPFKKGEIHMERLLLAIRKLIEYVVYAILIAMVLVICWQVFTRFALGRAPSWSQELSLLLMVWGGFLSIALGFQDKSHISIGMLVNKLPATAQKVIQLVNRLLAFLFGMFMLYQGGGFAKQMGASFIPGLKVPSSVLYFSVPVTGVIIAVYMLAEIFGKWSTISEEMGAEE